MTPPPSDGAHYRGQVTGVTEDKYSVHFVDYGNRETVPISSLFDIPVSLTQHKVCGIHCNIAATKTPVSHVLFSVSRGFQRGFLLTRYRMNLIRGYELRRPFMEIKAAR